MPRPQEKVGLRYSFRRLGERATGAISTSLSKDGRPDAGRT
jgi:hypothetical protein